MGIQTTVMQKFSVDAFASYVRNDSITHVYVAPPVVLHLAKDPGFRKEDLSSLKMLTSGGAPLAADLIRTVYQRLGIPVRQAFGLTESTAVCHIQVGFQPSNLLTVPALTTHAEMEQVGPCHRIERSSSSRLGDKIPGRERQPNKR